MQKNAIEKDDPVSRTIDVRARAWGKGRIDRSRCSQLLLRGGLDKRP